MVDFISEITNAFKNLSVMSIIDILIVAYIFYRTYMLIKETRSEQVLKGIILIIAIIPLCYIMGLTMLGRILKETIGIGVLALVVIFQPEIRRALEHIGRSAFEESHNIKNKEDKNKAVDEIVNAVQNLAEEKTGALIAIEQKSKLTDILMSGVELDAKITSNLLENIFVVNTPLHDGATIISESRIVSSGCVLPLTNNNNIDKKLGTRHRAAIGLSENTDAIVIIVSEETGVVSLAVNGVLTRNYDKEKLKKVLLKIMEKNDTKKVKFAGERVKLWLKELKMKE